MVGTVCTRMITNQDALTRQHVDIDRVNDQAGRRGGGERVVGGADCGRCELT